MSETGSSCEDVAAELTEAAALAVSQSKRKFKLELNPTVRTRTKTRLLRKLKQTTNEFTTRVGKQAIVLVANSPAKGDFQVFGSQPLETVIKTLKNAITDELERALAEHNPPAPEDPALFELPPLVVDGIPTPVEKMTQAQLRAFIPLMLRYATGRGKPGWGRESTRPPWWPVHLPWANVRMDVRTQEQKGTVSWTTELRNTVKCCYEFFGRQDLLPKLEGEEDPLKSALLKADALSTEVTPINQSNQDTPNQSASKEITIISPPFITLPDGTIIGSLMDDPPATPTLSQLRTNEELYLDLLKDVVSTEQTDYVQNNCQVLNCPVLTFDENGYMQPHTCDIMDIGSANQIELPSELKVLSMMNEVTIKVIKRGEITRVENI